ncbi:E3 ubiquitin-protein ligase TRIM39-like isoform X2 [Hemibagrus wyckioides]|uniref:E3 ubiquitin-protein ligase TRIM39-like isoform X2 n=1 Tax=Hemibagrus wyckioides TaxID=337641 RepID=UPI00266C2EE1|nr:E3 ubiquitin-protein ligase TRIM39-like isoform X2 [Hemibagrus wyckioides]
MTSSATGKHNTGASHSLVNLRNPRKEKEIKSISQSEPFIKPRLALCVIIPKIVSAFKFKKPEIEPQQTDSSNRKSKEILKDFAKLYRVSQNSKCPGEEKTIVLLDDSHQLGKNMQMSNTDSNKQNLPQKNNSECDGSEKNSVKSSGLQIPRKAWDILTRPSAKVILDPNTANPTLKLSADGRSVRTKTHKEFNSSQSFYEYQRKHKNQYNGWMCVQAKEGYSTGRHYWEVDVKGKCDWRVGVVKESAPRNGFINLNTAAGYWTLRLQLGSLMALTEPVTKLNYAPPAKLGVHLDMEEGQVSLYDVMKRKNIYTFNTEFRNCEKIFPVFGTVETDKPLKIIQI